MIKLTPFQQQYTTEPCMSSKQSGKSEVNVCRPEQEQLTGPDKQYLLRAFEDIKQQPVELKQQGIYLFEQWVTNIYKFKAKITDLDLLYEGIEISISPTAVESILRKVLAEVCQIHKGLIGDEMMIMLRTGSGEFYYKIDADRSEVGFFDCVNDQWEITQGTKLDGNFQAQRLTVNQQYYQYCVWVIYHHYCSLSECNKQICLLVEFIRQNSQGMYLKLYKHLQSKKIKNQDTDSDGDNEGSDVAQFFSKQNQLQNDFQKMISLIDNYQLVKESQLNILTITNLIPLAMTKFDDYINSNKLPIDSTEQSADNLYEHISRFQAAINSIIYKNKQNMRKFLIYFDQFKRAIKIIRNRLKNSKGNDKKETVLARHLRGLKQLEKKRNLNFRLFNEEIFQQEIEKKIEKQMQLQQFYQGGNLTIDEDEAQLVRNIDKLQFKQNGNKSHKSNQMGLDSNIDRQKFKFTQSKIHEKISNFKSMVQKQQKNSFLFNVSDKIQSISHFSAKFTQRNSEKLKFQVIFKKYQQLNESVNELQYNQTLKKVRSQCIERSRRQLIQQSKKKSQPLQITEQLKIKLSNLIRTKVDEQFTNFQKKVTRCENQSSLGHRQSSVLRDQENKLIYYSKQQKSQLNLHEFLQQNKFKHDLEDNEMDYDIFEQKIKEQQLKDQIKKKKKKLKKKKNKKQSQIEQNPNLQDKVDQINQGCEKQKQKQNKKKSKIRVLDILMHEIGQKQYDIIKNLEEMKIQRQNRMQCFMLSEDSLKSMKQRQIDILCRQSEVPQKSPNKGKTKNKKNRAN